MKQLKEYIIPVSGLKNGIKRFDFEVDADFFTHFENSLIEQGNIKVQLDFDKRPSLFVLDFVVQGVVHTQCDRCLAGIKLPIDGVHQLLVKFADGEQEDNDPDVLYVEQDVQDLDVSPFVYEYICLNVPFIKIYDCDNDDNPPCDDDMLDYLESREDTEETQEIKNNPIWDVLKDLNTNDN